MNGKKRRSSLYKYAVLFVLVIFISFLFWDKTKISKDNPGDRFTWWQFQAIDTMKYSRDVAGAKLGDREFEIEISTQVKNIAQTGATHIAIATPYDSQFLPFLRVWIREARKNNLKVWFRGNWSSWEGWFDFPRQMTFDEHIKKSVDFIKQNPDLFQNGDSFTACPECENGAQGDPRQTGKVEEYRRFLIDETMQTTLAFKSINKKVSTNWLSMNKDVADLIMDKETVKAVGGVITIDHYVKDPKQVAKDVNDLAAKTGAKIMLGEFGAPIPDIHGDFTQDQQAKWIEDSLKELSLSDNLIGVNYWTNRGSSTELWNDNNSPKKAVTTLTRYFAPTRIIGSVVDDLGNKLSDVDVRLENQKTKAKNGAFHALLLMDSELYFYKDGYKPKMEKITRTNEKQIRVDVVLVPENPSYWHKLQARFRTYLKSNF